MNDTNFTNGDLNHELYYRSKRLDETRLMVLQIDQAMSQNSVQKSVSVDYDETLDYYSNI
jgi:hypothetical protein